MHVNPRQVLGLTPHQYVIAQLVVSARIYTYRIDVPRYMLDLQYQESVVRCAHPLQPSTHLQQWLSCH